VNREQQRTKTADPENHNDQNFTMRDLAEPNGNEKRQPEAAIETATRSGKKSSVVNSEA